MIREPRARSQHLNKSRPVRSVPCDHRERLRERYDWLWTEAAGVIRAGRAELDPVLKTRLPDPRRGLTVIARPNLLIRQRVASFLDELRHVEPEQRYYARSEFHLTILSLFTATVDHGPLFARTEDYVSAVDSALRKVAPIQVEFKGITASPGTVMVQGFLVNDALNDLRDSLRQQLQVRNLGGGLDRRYRLETAHMTVARFRAPLRDGERFATALERARQRFFGTMSIVSLGLVKNDWYMTRQVLETVKRYRLARGHR